MIEVVEAVEATEVIEAAEVLRSGKSLLRASESSRHLKLVLYSCFEKKFSHNRSSQDHAYLK